MGKNPRISPGILSPSGEKKAKAHPVTSSNCDNPSWRLSRLEMVDPFGWHNIKTSQLHYVRERLQNFESMTWNQIIVEGKKHNHTVKTSSIAKTARDRLKDLRLDEVDELVSLKLSGEERVWGIRQGSALLLLWWDPLHKVCPSRKKHT